MSNLDKYKGIIPAFYACYDEQGNVSPERVRALTQYYVDKGVKGVYVNGSSGECIYQGVAERKIIIENVMAVAKGKLTVINHVACNNTRDSVELAKHSEEVGVDAIASIPPIYFRLPEYSIAAYWNAISAAAPNTDFVIYNIPQLAGTALTMSLFAEMMKNPKVVAVKNSSMPTQDIQMFKGAIGADGGIGGTYGVMPELFLKLNELIVAGERDKATELQYDINEIIYKMCSSHANMYAVAKEMLRINENLDLGGVREPLENLQEADKAVAKEAAAMVMAAKAKYC